MKWSQIAPPLWGAKGAAVEVNRVVLDSRLAGPGALFVAIPGRTVDGYDYIPEAIRRGASAVLSPRLHPEIGETPIWVAEDWQGALGQACAQVYGTNRRQRTLTAVTGTDGKTTTTALLRSMLEFGHIPTASVGTLGWFRPGERNPEGEVRFTTPLAPDLHDWLARLPAEAECVLEASSQALVQGRLAGLAFDRLILTHLAVDHLDYHGTVSEYAEAKLQLWNQLRTGGLSILPGADPLAWQVALRHPEQGHSWYFADPDHPLAQEAWALCKGSKARTSDTDLGGREGDTEPFVDASTLREELYQRSLDYGSGWLDWAKTVLEEWTYEERSRFWTPEHCWFIRERIRHAGGFTLRGVGPGGSFEMELPLYGQYNISNALAAWIAASTKLETETLAAGLAQVKGIEGRMELITSGHPYQVVVDFAHTVGSTRAVLEELRQHVSGGRLWTLCNASGDRDREKRPQIARLCSELADRVVLTLEEVGQEDPRQILAELEVGLTCPADWVIPFRPEAIRRTIDALEPGDLLLLPALGAERTCRVGKGSLPYSDRDWALTCVRNRVLREGLVEHLVACGVPDAEVWLGRVEQRRVEQGESEQRR